MPLIRVSPKTAIDPVYIDPHKIHTICGPIPMKDVKGPGQTEYFHIVRIFMDAGKEHDIRFSDRAEALERMGRVLKEHNASFSED